MNNQRLIHYLQNDLGVSDAALALIRHHENLSVTELPIVLWNHGLIDLAQMEAIFDWMQRAV